MRIGVKFELLPKVQLKLYAPKILGLPYAQKCFKIFSHENQIRSDDYMAKSQLPKFRTTKSRKSSKTSTKTRISLNWNWKFCKVVIKISKSLKKKTDFYVKSL
jgi:hypothetical protein